MAPLEETQHMADVAKLDKDGVFEEAFYTDPERLMKVVSCLAVIGGHLRIQTEDIGLIQYQSFAGGQEVSYMDAVDSKTATTVVRSGCFFRQPRMMTASSSAPDFLLEKADETYLFLWKSMA